ncbi:hypothetical protein EON79_01000 [bacterium]|nr:MAG: hypothetical protein EON79_01000 [bacterium]
MISSRSLALAAVFLPLLASAQSWRERVTAVESDRLLNGEATVLAVNNRGDALVSTTATNADLGNDPGTKLYWVAPSGAARRLHTDFDTSGGAGRFAPDGDSVVYSDGVQTYRYVLGAAAPQRISPGSGEETGLVVVGNLAYGIYGAGTEARTAVRTNLLTGTTFFRPLAAPLRGVVAISSDARRIVSQDFERVYFEAFSDGWQRGFTLQKPGAIFSRDALSVWYPEGTRLVQFDAASATKRFVNAGSRPTVVGAIGAKALFTTLTRLKPEDRNDNLDLYLADAADGSVRLVSLDETGLAAGIGYGSGVLSDDGSTVGYANSGGKAFVRRLNGSEPREVPLAIGDGGRIRRPDAGGPFLMPVQSLDAGTVAYAVPYGSGRRTNVDPAGGPTRVLETIDLSEAVTAVDETGGSLAFARSVDGGTRLRVAPGVRGGSVVGLFADIGQTDFDASGRLWFLAIKSGSGVRSLNVYDPATKLVSEIDPGGSDLYRFALGGSRVAWIKGERLYTLDTATGARYETAAPNSFNLWLTGDGSIITIEVPGSGLRRIRLSDGTERPGLPDGVPSRDGAWIFPTSPGSAYRIADGRYVPAGIAGDPVGPFSPILEERNGQLYRFRPVLPFLPSASINGYRLAPNGGIYVTAGPGYRAGDGNAETWAEARIDGGPWVRLTDYVETLLPAAEGRRILEIRARDAQNRVEAPPFGVALYTDATGPTLGPVTVGTEGALYASVAVRDSRNVRLVYGKTSAFGYTETAFDNFGDPTWYAYPSVTTKGKYVAQFIATDQAGNEGRSEKFVFEVK